MCKSSDLDAFFINQDGKVDKVAVNIDIIKAHIRKQYSIEALADLRATTTLNVSREIADLMVMELAAFLAGKKVNTIHVDIEYPADWWQAFKERWFPQWMINRWPIKYKRVYINENQYAICPHLTTEQKTVHYEFLRTAEDRKTDLFDRQTA